MLNNYNKENDLGYKLSIKSIEAYEKGDYVKAFFHQAEALENSVTAMIVGRARYLGMNEKEVQKLAYKGSFNTRINNLTKISGEKFSYLCNSLHDYRERRNRIIHRKSEFQNEAELERYAKESWELGTDIIACFIDSIKNYPTKEEY